MGFTGSIADTLWRFRHGLNPSARDFQGFPVLLRSRIPLVRAPLRRPRRYSGCRQWRCQLLGLGWLVWLVWGLARSAMPSYRIYVPAHGRVPCLLFSFLVRVSVLSSLGAWYLMESRCLGFPVSWCLGPSYSFIGLGPRGYSVVGPSRSFLYWVSVVGRSDSVVKKWINSPV